MRRLSQAGLALLAGTLLLGGCPRTGPPVPPDPVPSDPHEDTGDIATGSADPVQCGSGGERVERYAWLPPSAQAVASIDLGDAQLQPAIERLVEHARGSEHEMPIGLAFALGQWNWQVALVSSTLKRAGYAPAELVYVRMDDGTSAWIWSMACDLDQAVAATEAAWPVRVRRGVSAAIGTPVEGDPESTGNTSFPFDVVFLEGERAALVPAGRGASFVQDLVDSRPPGGDRVGAHPGGALAEVPPAPIRLVWGGRALLDPGRDTTNDPLLQAATANPAGVHDVTVQPP